MTENDGQTANSSGANTSPRVNPYIGPRPFQPGEKIFGRDLEKRDLIDQILAERIVLLHSPSGAGKTSLIMAGLIPVLRAEGLHILPVVRVGEEPPERFTSREGFNRFIFSMMLSLDGELEPTVPAQDGIGESQEMSEAEQAEQEAQRQARLDELAEMSLKEYLVQRRKELDTDLNVIIFDQFEEIINTEPTDLRSKRDFFSQVGEVLSDRSLWALFVIRDDYLGALENFAVSLPTQLTSTFRLDLLGSTAAQQAIQKPVAQNDITFLDSAAQKLVDDMRLVQTQAPDGEIVSQLGLYVEPVQLQVVCLRLYDQLDLENRLDKTQIDDDDIKNVGDVSAALADYYAERVAEIAGSLKEERQVRDWFHEHLITKSGLRSQVMMEVGESGGLDNKLIRKLGEAHLVRAEKRRGVTWFELAHDRMVRPVQTDNRRWRRENLNLWQQRAIEWQRNGQPDAMLLRGVNLDQARAWADEHQVDLNEIDSKYLQSSITWRETHLSPLQRKAAEWESQGCPEDELLLIGSDLQQASDWAMTNTEEITSRELEYLEASREAAQREERKKQEQAMQLEFERERADEQEKTNKSLRRRAILLGIAMVVALSMFAFAMLSLNSAVKNSNANATLAVENEEFGVSQSTLAAENEAYGDEQGTVAADQAAIARAQETQAAESKALADEKVEQNAENARLLMTSMYQEDVAKAQQATAEVGAKQALSRQLASQGRSFLDRRPDLGILLGIKAYQADSSSWDARSILLEGLRTGLEQNVQPYELNIPTQLEKINNVNISPDGRLVAWSGADGKIILWDVATRTTRVLQDPDQIFISSQAFSPTDPDLLVTGNMNSQILFWDLSDDSFERVRAVGTSPEGNRYNHGRVRRLEFNPRGDRLAIHGQTANIAIWDVDSRGQLDSFKAEPNFYWDLDWSPDNRYLAAAGGDNYLYIFDPGTGSKAVPRLQNPERDGRLYNVDWSPDSERVAFGGASGTRFANIYFFDMAARELLPDRLESGSSTIYTISYNSPDGELIAAAGFNTPVEIWQTKDGTRFNPLPNYSDYQNGLSFIGDLLAYVAFQSSDLDAVSVYEVKVPNPLNQALPPFVGDTPVLASGDSDELWIAGTAAGGVSQEQRADAGSSSDRQVVDLPPSEFPYRLAYGPDHSLLVALEDTGDVYLWEPGADQVEPVLAGLPVPISALAASPDGVTLAAGFCQAEIDQVAVYESETSEQPDSPCSVHLYDLQSSDPLGEQLGETISTTQSSITSLAFSLDGTELASGGQDGTIHLIDLETGKPGDIPMGGINAIFTSLAYSPDGITLASGTDQGDTSLWDVRSGQALGKPFKFGNRPLSSLAYSPDGDMLYVASDGGQLSAWDVDYGSWVQRACVLAGRDLTEAEWRQFLPGVKQESVCQAVLEATPVPPTPTITPTP